MLIEFQVGNFLSFKETVTFSMVASDIDSQDRESDSNSVFAVNEELNLLQTAAIYGANASGKSNFAKAFGFMKRFVIDSSRQIQITDEIEIESFRLSTITKNKPSFFQANFWLNNKFYRYGFEVTKEKVVKEWLFCTTNVQEYNLFTRNKNRIKISPKFFKEGKGLEDKTKHNSLFLSVSAQFNGRISEQILKWFFNCQIISGTQDRNYRNITIKYFESSLSQREDIVQFIKDLDLYIYDIRMTKESVSLPSEMPEELKSLILRSASEISSTSIQTLHEKYNEEGEVVGTEKFELEENESEGTKKLFYFSGILLNALKNGHLIVIDELDAKLHPIITHKIVQLFNSNKYNSKGAQLIFMTHDTNLLSSRLFGSRLLRRDQIWFTEKNKQGATDLYSLVEYDIQEDASFESDYIRGKYGAIPFIGNFRQLLASQEK
ncbi:ATP/GTP-binding protein [Aerosakkonemataceae cyanobacterium BLCC-F154]|uniref:ATP/GTP-binding protein n=1 Tax=Floridaenema fluviatile BLCC-F154 TaxID=3153640 RepID=A0ABV4Y987_9CYAN